MNTDRRNMMPSTSHNGSLDMSYPEHRMELCRLQSECPIPDAPPRMSFDRSGHTMTDLMPLNFP